MAPKKDKPPNKILDHQRNPPGSVTSGEVLSPDRSRDLSRAVTIAQSHSGPLPAPETLEKYESIMPGLAERIVRWSEEETLHRRSLQKREMDIANQDRSLEREHDYRDRHCR